MDQLQGWCERLNIRLEAGKPVAWRKEQLEYRFEVNPPPSSQLAYNKIPGHSDPNNPSEIVKFPPTTLVAPSYRNGDLDWHTFNVASNYRGLWEKKSTRMRPTQISIAGASPRWWAFEDSAINLGQMEVGKTDLARLILMEFVLAYGDDWFAIPLPIQMANLVKTQKLTVTDVFGQVEEIVPAQQKVRESIRASGKDPNDEKLRWELFTLSPWIDPAKPGISDPQLPGAPFFGTEAVNVLLIPPVAGIRQESTPFEEIYFLRDEGANMVWGVEYMVRNGLGQPVRGFDMQGERIERQYASEMTQAAAEQITRYDQNDSQPASSAPHYRLATSVPENWIPFLPSNARALLGRPGIRLRRAEMLRNTDDEQPTSIPAMTQLLGLEGDLLLWLEEPTVPRAGLHYQLTAQRMRWFDGKTYVWLGRKVLTGRGEGSSGLKFDVLR
jgi:hypothetical protein